MRLTYPKALGDALGGVPIRKINQPAEAASPALLRGSTR
jgi:hypothetical protein